MELNLGLGLFDDIPEGEPHPLQIDVFEDESDVLNRLINSKTNIYRPVKGDTELHRAIRSGDQSTIDGILDAYQRDFNKIRDYIVLKYHWDPDDRIWLRKLNLVAADEDQCKSVKCFERNSTVNEDLGQAVFVLLQIPVDGEEVAVLHPKNCDRLEVFQIICKLIPNGFLTWNCSAFNETCETFVEAAAARGNNYTITRLYALGVQLSPPNHNPLLAACSSLRKDTIHYLLRDHFDHFDFTQRNNYRNAFMVLMQKKDTEMLDFVLQKMIHYRQKYYEESKSQAFNNIFRYENEEYSSISILPHLRPGPVRRKIEEYIAEFELDLSYQWKNATILQELLSHKLAPEYCRIGIQKNPKLLGLKIYGESTVMHQCIRFGLLHILRDMYVQQPEVKKYFENDRGFTSLQEALVNNHEDAVAFMLENHKEFFLRDFAKLEDVVLSRNNPRNFYERNGALLFKHFPELKGKIEDKMLTEQVAQIFEDQVQNFRKITEKLKNDQTAIITFQLLLSNIRGPGGETVLHYAVENDNLALVKKLLEAGCNLDSLDNEGNHPIHCIRSVDMLNLITENHPDGQSLVHRTNSTGYSVLHKLCRLYMDNKTLIILLEKVFEFGADVNQLTNSGDSAVFITSSPTILQVLINHNINLEVVNNEGETALGRHLRHQNTCMVRTLLPLLHRLPSFQDHANKYLPQLVKTKRYGFDANYRSFLEANPETTKLLFDSVYENSRDEASRLFNLACFRSRIFFVDKFLQFNYDLNYNYQNEYGYTPIMELLCCNKEAPGDLIGRLLAKGVDLELRNQRGQNALLMIVNRFESARWYGHSFDTVQLLLDHGTSIDSTDDAGNTALHLAFQRCEWELIEVLVRNGGDLNVKNKDGQIPYAMGTSLCRELFRFMC